MAMKLKPKHPRPMKAQSRTFDARGKRPTQHDLQVVKLQRGSCLLINAIGECKRITQRELELIRLFALGLSSKEAAVKLNLSTHTVNNHRRNMKAGTACSSIPELVRLLTDNGLM
jgi:DNA-binding CsgD family transcriptional regulator